MIDTAHLSPWLWVVAPLVIVFAYTIFGISGFGSTAIAVPILAHFLPLAVLVPLMVMLDLAAATFIGTAGRRHLDRRELLRVLPFLLIGIVLGVTLLVHLPEEPLKVALGLFAVVIGIHALANPTVRHTVSWWWGIPTGIVGGAVAAVFGAGGPIYATYFSARIHEKSAVRATVSTMISVSAFARALAYALGGLLLHATLFIAMLALAPCVYAGLKIGTHIHAGLTHDQMRRLIGVLLVLIGASLLVRTLA